MKTYKLICKHCKLNFISQSSNSHFCENCATIEIKCENCSKLFTTKRLIKGNYKKYCSRSCMMTAKWKDSNYKSKMSQMTKDLWANDEHKNKMKKIHESETWRNKQSENQYKHLETTGWKKPVIKKRVCKYCGEEFEIMSNLPYKYCSRSCAASDVSKETRKLISKRMTKFYENGENRKKISYRRKKYLSDSENRKKLSQQTTKYFKNIENRKRLSKVIKKKWTDEEYRQKMIKSLNNPEVLEKKRKSMLAYWADTERIAMRSDFHHGIYYKYIFPSGKIVKVQGYESQVIDELLKTVDEKNIVAGRSNIINEIGIIKYYFDDALRNYFPDIYIKSTNTIIEVKSQWTFDKWEEKNLAKKQACLQQGFNFEFIII